MPAKQVYGKRTKSTATSYSKFISPDKDENFARKTTRRGGRDNTSEKEHDVGLVGVEKQLEALILDKCHKSQPNSSEEEFALLRAQEQNDGSSPGAARKVDVAVSVNRRLESVPPQGDLTVVNKDNGKKRGRPRKALKSRDANAETKPELRKIKQSKHEQNTRDNGAKKQNSTTDSENHVQVTKEEQTLEERLNAMTLQPTNSIDGQRDTTKRIAPATSTPSALSPNERGHCQSLPPMRGSENIYTTYVAPLLALSEQHNIIPFEQWSSELDTCVDVTKIAEASFSEVYRLTVRNAKLGTAGESVLKIVPIRTAPGTPLPSECTTDERPRRKGDITRQLKKEQEKREEEDQWKSRVEDVECEARLLQNLNCIPGFTNFRELTILQGRLSPSFGQAWKEWNKSRPKGKKSEFPDPTKRASYDDTQLWAVIEMQDAGTDCGKIMEKGGINTIWEVWDIFWGVCLSVAKAEEACRFEHRDLHMDNICIRSSRPDSNLTDCTVKNPVKRKLGFTGFETTVIDYTLSRADIIAPSSGRSSLSTPLSSRSSSFTSNSDTSHNPEVAYLDLDKDPALFEGDAEVEYQYEIYRYMRGVVYHNDPFKFETETPDDALEHALANLHCSPRKHDDHHSNDAPRRSPRKQPQTPSKVLPLKPWKHFYPKTNLVWAHFILYSLLSNLSDSGNEPADLSPTDLIANIIDVDMAGAPRIHKKAVKLHKILLKVAILLEPGRLGPKSKLMSMRDLVILALEGSWLSPQDVSGGALD